MLMIWSGWILWKYRKRESRRIDVCSSDTPFTLWDPTRHKLAMRTRFSTSFEKIDVFDMISSKSGSFWNRF